MTTSSADAQAAVLAITAKLGAAHSVSNDNLDHFSGQPNNLTRMQTMDSALWDLHDMLLNYYNLIAAPDYGLTVDFSTATGGVPKHRTA